MDLPDGSAGFVGSRIHPPDESGSFAGYIRRIQPGLRATIGYENIEKRDGSMAEKDEEMTKTDGLF